MTAILTSTGAYRAPMRRPDTDDASAAEWAINAGVVGVDGAIRGHPEDLDEVLAAAAHEHGERTARRIQRFARTPAGSFVWTRDRRGGFHLGRLSGGWRYDPGALARELGLSHQRSCDWADGALPGALVPVAVMEAFGRGGRNWQQIRAAGAAEASARAWSIVHDG